MSEPTSTVTEHLPEEEMDEVEASRAPLMSHLVELRRRLIICVIALLVAFGLCFALSYQLYNALTLPFVEATERAGVSEQAVLHYPPLGLFFARVKIAFFAGLMVAFPVIAWQLYAFVAPGLYRHERRSVYPFLIAIPFLFAAGIALVHQFILPFVMDFALSMEAPAEAAGQANYALLVFVGDYLSLALTLILAFGFAFQMPIVMVLLGRAGVITADWLRRNRRFAIVIIFLFAAFLTPPDPVSQLTLGLTLMALYEISVLMVALMAKRAEADQSE